MSLLSVAGVVLLILVILIVLLLLANRAPDMSRYDNPEPELMVEPAAISPELEKVHAKLKAYHAGPQVTNIKVGRQKYASLFDAPVDGEFVPVDIDGIPGEWVLTENTQPDNRLLYLHGGAFMVGSPATNRFITSQLANGTNAAVLAIDYRMMPEHTVIDAHDDARAAYRWLLDNGPDGPAPAHQLFIAGDSAGGNLTLSTIAWARDNGLQPVAAAVALAPATDSTLTAPTWKSNLATDRFLGPSLGRLLKIPAPVRMFLTRMQLGRKITDPTFSPLLGNLDNLPPTLIQVSTAEMLYAEAVRYANRAAEAGSEVELQAWPKLVHVFQLFGELPEAAEALKLASTFINKHRGN